MLILMLLDPLLYNGIIYYFVNYLWVKSREEGGCCEIKSTNFALNFFFIIYLTVSFLFAIIITLSFFNCVTPNPVTGLRGKRIVVGLLVATLTNTHLFLFGFFPSFHQAFDV